MKLLLDTHALLWYTLNDSHLSSTAETLIKDAANEILLSPASYWELAIKISMGKLTLNQPFDDFLDACLNKYGFLILPILPQHAAFLTTLPFHHKDPFDRLLIAQALVEKVAMVSADGQFDVYGVQRFW